MATNVEVFWPDGHSVARPLEPSDINSVLEIHYSRVEEEVTPTVEIEVQQCLIVILNAHHLEDCLACRTGLATMCTEMKGLKGTHRLKLDYQKQAQKL